MWLTEIRISADPGGKGTDRRGVPTRIGVIASPQIVAYFDGCEHSAHLNISVNFGGSRVSTV
jgi:hypothetical protein